MSTGTGWEGARESVKLGDGEPRIVLLDWKSANAYPKPANRVDVYLAPLSEALITKHRTDAHFQALTTTECRRLGNAAVGHVPIAMVYLVADTDDPVAHRLGTSARAEWHDIERPKIVRLHAAHPNAIVYQTNGGYRIIFRCAPFAIATREDARAWWDVYGRFRRYLRTTFGIVADPTCKDFSRLYRLPCVRRDGKDVTSALLGDPENIEVLDMGKLPEAPREAHPYVRGVLRKAIDAVLGAANGARNDVLNKEAFSLGGFVPGGYLDENELHDALLNAILKNGGDEAKDSRKILDAIERGKTKPRDPPQRQTRRPAPHPAPEGVEGEPDSGRDEGDEEDEGLDLDGRPVIYISHEIGEMTACACDALRDDPDLYKRDCQLVHVARAGREQNADASKLAVPEGTPRIRPLSFALLKERLSVFVQWVVYKRKKPHHARPDCDVIAALHSRGDWPSVRPLVGVVEAPFMRADGEIVQTAGYDVASGCLYAPSIVFPPMPARPTRDEARAALAKIADLLVDFPHEKAAHKMVPIAHALTVLARPAIRGSVPAFMYDANTRGSGKSLQTDVVAMLCTGRVMPRMHYTADEVEQEKILGALALEGASSFSMDNVSSARPFGGSPIERAITATGTIKFRILGMSTAPTLPWLAVMCATGNNITYTPDTVRRVVVSRLESPEAKPEDRTEFRHPRLVEHVRANRAELAVDLLTILRAFVVAGRPSQGLAWGSFEQWTELVAQAIVWAGGANVLDARPSGDDASNPRDAAMVAFLTGMLVARRKDGTPLGEFTSAELFESFFSFGLTLDASRGSIRAAIESLCVGKVSTSKAIGVALGGFRRRVFICGERSLMLDSRVSHGATRWTIRDVTARGATQQEDPIA